MKKNRIILLSLLGIIVIGVALIFLIKQKPKKIEVTKIDPGFREYIIGYTGGVIPSKSTIRMRLSAEHKQEVEPNSLIDEKLFKFEPSIKGTTFWIDNQTIEFKPETRLPSGTSYQGEFLLSKIIEVPDKYKTFAFQFQTIKQSFTVTEDNLKTYDKKNLKLYKLEGNVLTADFIENEEIEKILKASQDGKKLSISWDHKPDIKKHLFQVDSINRKAEDGEVIITWDGTPIGVEIKGEKKVEVPGLDNFKLIKVQVIQQPEQHVLLQFSDPLQSNQDLAGLVRIKGESRLTYSIIDNEIKVYPAQRLDGSRKITVEKGIKNILGYKLKEKESSEITFEAVKPEVRLIGKGVIMPNSNGLIFPFESVNLSAVDVQIIKIYEDNVAQFLQVNTLEGNTQMKRVGRPILKKKIELVSDHIIDYATWNVFSIDLSDLIQTDPGAIYKVELSFKKRYSLYPCEETGDDEEELEESWDADDEAQESGWDGIEEWYYDDYYYSWYDRDNPCKKAYYQNKKVGRNVLASDLGLIAKAGKNKTLYVSVSDLRTTKPVGGVDLEILNYQQQIIGKGTTNNDGFAQVKYDMKPFLLVAKNGDQRGYLKLEDGASLSLSKFDVSGEEIQKGLKGFLYGERGVWRPGDSLYLTFILEDKEKTLPPAHPVTFELIDPMGQVVQKMVKTSGLNNFYSFNTKTNPDAPTGNWTGKVKVGGASFSQTLKIETVKPNRLKINIDFGVDRLTLDDKYLQGDLIVKWLHGAVAKNLQAEVDVTLQQIPTRFNKYQDFIFDDPSRQFYSEEMNLFDGRLDENGQAKITANIKVYNQSPGMLNAIFNTRVFEEGGDYSIDQFSIPYAPYRSFIGIKLPKGDAARGMLLTDTDHKVEVVTVDANGKEVSLKNLEAIVYKVSWRWWWEAGSDNLASYVGSSYSNVIETKTFSTTNGIGEFTFKIKYPDWGRYFVRIKTPDGHATGKTVYVDWPGWAGRAQRESPGGASMLTFTTDKKNYQVGETVQVTIPSSENGRALISIETGSKVINSYWVETQAEQTAFSFKTTEAMAPNAYINISLLQPHAQTANDLPIRLYGIMPIFVVDPATKINPVIDMPDELSSEASVKMKIKEKNGKPMTYTVAIVDEGLLDLTRFQTPDPWQKFYAREALGVKTWDLYDMILGAYGGEIEQIFGIGGGFEEEAKEKKKKADRFKPVVKFFGPYHLKSNGTGTVSFKMPKYIGSVRAMVVAGDQGAYGFAEKAVPVKNPLMILATLPRVLGPGEKVKLPVIVFAMDDKIKNVKVEVKASDLFTIKSNVKNVPFNKSGEKDIYFSIDVSERIGVGNISVIATSENEKASYDVEIDVRNPNPRIVDTYSTIVEPGNNWNQPFNLPGMNGTNEAILEVSAIPPIDLGRRLQFLIQYPHGCVEQTTSSVFPQLFLEDVMEIDKEMSDKIKTNVQAGIERLKTFQLSDGGLGYWPGASQANDWGTNYAGHFMLEAEAKGYSLPSGFKNNWIDYQKERANSWSSGSKYNRDDLIQAYRLYTLALAKKADLGAMNRLRESGNLSKHAKWRLAAAYAITGKKDIAEELILQLDTSVDEYSELSYTYGSSERDRAMILETLSLLKKFDIVVPIMEKLSETLKSKKWLSTQTTAYCLIAMSKLAKTSKENSKGLKYEYKIENKSEKVTTQEAIAQHRFSIQGTDAQTLSITNNGEALIYVNYCVEGLPLVGEETPSESNLKLGINYRDMNGNYIDITRLEQGTDFKVEVTITNPGLMGEYKEMALTQIFPSGWEIRNIRLFEGGSTHIKDEPTYQDYRDDRVYTYFDLNAYKNKTFVILLNAAYLGEFYLPAVYCEAMYDNRINARKTGRWVEVVRAGE